jgi:hypothetical protein
MEDKDFLILHGVVDRLREVISTLNYLGQDIKAATKDWERDKIAARRDILIKTLPKAISFLLKDCEDIVKEEIIDGIKSWVESNWTMKNVDFDDLQELLNSLEEYLGASQAGKPIYGVLDFYSETGTEGGYWAFQDERFITPNRTQFSCKICYLFWDKARSPKSPPSENRIGYALRHMKIGLLRKILRCWGRGHKFEKTTETLWSFNGFHILESGNELTIYGEKERVNVLWSGTINLKDLGIFKENAFGYWIHNEQIGVPRETWASWFMNQKPAMLVKGEPC